MIILAILWQILVFVAIVALICKGKILATYKYLGLNIPEQVNEENSKRDFKD